MVVAAMKKAINVVTAVNVAVELVDIGAFMGNAADQEETRTTRDGYSIYSSRCEEGTQSSVSCHRL